MKKLKIGFDAKRLFHNHTGLGNYSRTLVRNLQKYHPEHEYYLFTPRAVRNTNTEYFFDEKKFKIVSYDGYLSSIWRSYGMTREINQLDLDIYHGLSHEIPMNAHRLNCKTVVTFHDLIYEIYPKQFSWWDRMQYQRKYRYAAKHADKVIAISESTKRDIIDHYNVSESKIEVIYQSCHPSFIKDEGKLSSDEKYFLYVGSVIERKSFKDIIEAMRQMPSDYRIPVKVVGTGGSYAAECKALIAENQLEEWFDWMHHVDNQDLVSLYDGAVALIYPSIYEGFGIPIIEALSRSTPVITTTASSLPEAAGPGAILITPHDTDALASTMIKVQSYEEEIQKMIQEGHAYVRHTFNPEKLAAELISLYSKL